MRKEEFISNSEGYHFDESKFDDFDTAKTVYIGAGKSGLSYRFYDRIRKYVQNIIRHLMKSAVGNGQKCNCVMIRLMCFAMTFKDRPLELGKRLSGYWQTTYALSCQTEMKVIKADGKRVGFGNAFLLWGLETASTKTAKFP